MAVKGGVSFQHVNTDLAIHLPLKMNGPDSFFHCVGHAIPPPQQACYLPSIVGTHLHWYTWVEKINYGKCLPYSRTQHINLSQSHVYESCTNLLLHHRHPLIRQFWPITDNNRPTGTQNWNTDVFQ